jgi:hypothetical protein
MTTLQAWTEKPEGGPAPDRVIDAPALIPDPEADRRSARSGRFLWRTIGVPLGLLVLAGLGLMSSPGVRHGSAASPAVCRASDWQTDLTVDGSRPELAMTTLRSKNTIGPPGSCVDVRLACLRDGPYFEVRLASPGLRIRDVGPLQMRGLNEDLSARVFQSGGSEASVRIAGKEEVELIAFALANSLGFRVPITLSTGETGIADFRSYHFSTAVRPVLFACNMRMPQNDDSDDDNENESN